MVLPGTKSDSCWQSQILSWKVVFKFKYFGIFFLRLFQSSKHIQNKKVVHIQLLSFISVFLHNRTDKSNCTMINFLTWSFLLLGYQGLYVDCHFDSEPLRTIQTKVGVIFLTWTNLNFYLLSGTFVSFLCVCLASLFNCAKFTCKTNIIISQAFFSWPIYNREEEMKNICLNCLLALLQIFHFYRYKIIKICFAK